MCQLSIIKHEVWWIVRLKKKWHTCTKMFLWLVTSVGQIIITVQKGKITCYQKLDHCLTQFKNFYWLSLHELWAIIPCSTNKFGKIYLYFIKELFHLHLLDIKWLWPPWPSGSCWLSLISHSTCASRIIVCYMILKLNYTCILIGSLLWFIER